MTREIKAAVECNLYTFKGLVTLLSEERKNLYSAYCVYQKSDSAILMMKATENGS